jgi:transposase
MFLGDKALDADERVREPLRNAGITAVIPPKSNRPKPPPYDKKTYKERNHIERLFQKLKQCRAFATRYDKTKVAFISAVYMIATMKWIL